MHIRNHCGHIKYQLRLKGTVECANANGRHRTYVEDLEDPDKVLLPSRDLVSIAPGEKKSGGCTPFTLLDYFSLDLGHGPVIESIGKYVARRANCKSGSRSQIPNRVEDTLVEFIQSLSLQSPV